MSDDGPRDSSAPELRSDARAGDPWVAAYSAVYGQPTPPPGWTPPPFPRLVDDGTGVGATPVQCPFCREPIRADAIFCKHCRRDVEPQLSGLLEWYHLHEQHQRIVAQREAAAREAQLAADRAAAADLKAARRARRRSRRRTLIPVLVGVGALLIAGAIPAFLAIASETERSAQERVADDASEAEAMASDAERGVEAEYEDVAQSVAEARPGSVTSCRAVYGTEQGLAYLSGEGVSLESKCDRMSDSAVLRWADPSYATKTAASLTLNGAPDGFWPYEGGLSAKWAEDTDPNFVCSESSACWNVLVYAGNACPGGVYGEILVREDGTGVIKQSVGALTPPLGAGEIARLAFGVGASDTSTQAEIADLVCNP